jgi:hypothetical protein
MLIVLKLVGLLPTWSWWGVFVPLWIELGLRILLKIYIWLEDSARNDYFK